MTEESDNRPTRYLDKDDLKIVHGIVSDTFREDGEPIPPFSSAAEGDIDALVAIPRQSFFGNEPYPSLASKAAIIFYTVNKKHMFENGNKRLSVAIMTVFLDVNGKRLDVTEDELTEKAFWLAKTTHGHDFDEIKNELTDWIQDNLIDDEFDQGSSE